VDEAEFDRFADEYRAMHADNIRVSGESPEYFAEYKIVDVAGLLPPERFPNGPDILDFGAGVGTSVPYFLKYFPKARLTCLDVSRKSLDQGESRFRSQASFVHFDGARIPFPDGQFDLAFLACVLHHIPHAEHVNILRELRRILRPGGALVIFEHNPYNPLTVRAVNTCRFDENAVLLRPGRLQANVATAGFDAAAARFRIFLPHALQALRRFEPRMTWLPLGAQYYVHARKG
jgi:SAM-dependent methyltransferase